MHSTMSRSHISVCHCRSFDLNSYLFPKSVITYTPHINMDITLKFNRDGRPVYCICLPSSDIDRRVAPILNRKPEVDLNIAVTGDTGAGKSSFINAMLK